MEQSTIDSIRKRYHIGREISDAQVAEAFAGSSAEARVNLRLAVDDLKAALVEALPTWIKQPPRIGRKP